MQKEFNILIEQDEDGFFCRRRSRTSRLSYAGKIVGCIDEKNQRSVGLFHKILKDYEITTEEFLEKV